MMRQIISISYITIHLLVAWAVSYGWFFQHSNSVQKLLDLLCVLLSFLMFIDLSFHMAPHTCTTEKVYLE